MCNDGLDFLYLIQWTMYDWAQIEKRRWIGYSKNLCSLTKQILGYRVIVIRLQDQTEIKYNQIPKRQFLFETGERIKYWVS